MTLVLTVVTVNRVVQVSDRLLTWPDGSTADDRANKAVCVSCADGWFTISYSGAAQVGARRKQTDEWLVDVLAAADAGNLRCADVTSLIAMSAQNDGLGGNPPTIPTCLVTAGYQFVAEKRVAPFLAEIRNYDENPSGLVLRPFRIEPWRLKATADPRTAMIFGVSGMDSALTRSIRRRVGKLTKQRFFHKAPVEEISNRMASLIRVASGTPEAKGRIGRDCMAVALEPERGHFLAQYYPAQRSPEAFAPHLIQPGMAFKGVQMWTGDGPPPWWSANTSPQ